MRRAPILLLSLCACASSSSPDSDAGSEGESTTTSATDTSAGSAGASETSPDTGETSTETGATPPTLVWPISASPEPDADPIRHPYGPRWIGRYDFHAGIDINVEIGTPVHAVAAGTVVSTSEWDGESSSGTTALVEHADDRFTAYLHLSELLVTPGQELAAGELLGRSGDTGANTPHLHLTYMVGLTGGVDERRSRNPLEWLPHTEQAPAVELDDAGWQVALSAQRMRLGRVEMFGGDEPHDASYADIVALGSEPRDEHAHFGVWFDVSAGPDEDASFTLTLRPDPDEAGLGLRLWDFDGETLWESD